MTNYWRTNNERKNELWIQLKREKAAIRELKYAVRALRDARTFEELEDRLMSALERKYVDLRKVEDDLKELGEQVYRTR